MHSIWKRLVGLDIEDAFLSDDLQLGDLINEEFPDSMYFNMEGSWRNRGITRGCFLNPNLPRWGRGRCRICLEHIFKTGLSTEEYDRYYYSGNF